MKRIVLLVACLVAMASAVFGQGVTSTPPIPAGADLKASGTIGSTSDVVSLPTNGMSTCLITVSGSPVWSMTLVVNAQNDAGGWVGPMSISTEPAPGSPVTSVTYSSSAQTFRFQCAGYKAVEVVCPVTYVSGTVTVWLHASMASAPGAVASAPLPSNAAKETGGHLATIDTSTATTATNTTALVTAGGGGYVRQDSTATIAKESGGHLAAVDTSAAAISTHQTDGTAKSIVVSQVSTLTDRSGSITTGGTAQQLAASNSTRKYYIIQNTSTADLWYSFTSTAVVGGGSGSYRLPAGATVISDAQWVSSQAISIIGASTGQTWTAGEN